MSNTVFNPSWWLSCIVSTMITMCFVVLIKRVTAKVNIPVVSDIVQEV